MERSTIHLLHKRGKSQREIASELGHSRSAVARVLEEPVDRQASGRRRESNVDPFREQIGEWLKQGLSEQLCISGENEQSFRSEPYSDFG